MKRGIIIKGIKRGLNIGAILNYANSLLKVKSHYETKDRNRSDLCLFFDKDGDDLFVVAHKLRTFTKANVDVKYINTPHEGEPVKKKKNVDRKEFGNPYLKPSKNSFIESSRNNIESDAPMLRIDLNLEDVNELFEFLGRHSVNTQTKKRYKEALLDKTLSDNHDDFSHRTTFVADNINIDKSKVSVYVNGVLTDDIGCQVEEKADAYILHLFYKGEREYSKAVAIRKDEAQKPVLRFRDQEEGQQLSVEGKHLSITFKGYDSYLQHVRGKSSEEKCTPSTKYVGQPSRKRKTAIVKQTEVSTSEDETRVLITEPSQIQNETAPQKELEELEHVDTLNDSHKGGDDIQHIDSKQVSLNEKVVIQTEKKNNWFFAFLRRILDWLHK